MTGFEDDKLELRAKEMDSEANDDNILEEEDIDEFADDDDLDVNFKPGQDRALDSVEIDVEQILSEIAAEANSADAANVRVRKRLEAMMERKRRHQDLIDFDEYDIES